MTIFNGSSKNEEHCKVLTEKNEPVAPPNNDHRKKTDRWFLFIFISCMVLLLPLLIYTWIYSDINRYNGYDLCGNICGQKNVRYDQWSCTGQDMTLKPFKYLSDCITEGEMNTYSYRYGYNKQNILTNSKNLTRALSLAYFIPFCNAVPNIGPFYSILTGLYSLDNSHNLLAATSCNPCIYLDTYLLSTVPWYIFYRNVIDNVLCLDTQDEHSWSGNHSAERSCKTLVSIRSVIFNAAMTSIISLALWLLLLIASSIIWFYLKTSGVLTETYGKLYYTPDAYMEATTYLNLIIIFWIVQFVIGIGYLNASEDIVNRYFLRNQEICTSNIALKYHSGTVALTSLLSTIMFIPRVILIVFAQIPFLKNFMYYCLRYMDGYFSNSVYIMTAMNGTSFRDSGKNAVKLFRSSVGNTEDVNFFGNTVIFLAQLIVTIPCVVYLIIYYNIVQLVDITFLLLTVYISTETILVPFKIAMSTIFFCTCQDNLQKKEAKQPYTTSMTDYFE